MFACAKRLLFADLLADLVQREDEWQEEDPVEDTLAAEEESESSNISIGLEEGANNSPKRDDSHNTMRLLSPIHGQQPSQIV